jgi:lipoprotein-anchoring transpeptidase ErfK/SrfK
VTITIAAAVAALVLYQGQPQKKAEHVLSGLATQVMLDRAGFSPGAIDGLMGRNTRQALAAYESQKGKLEVNPQDTLTSYTITPEDVQGLLSAIPEDMVEKSKLQALGYSSAVEALAERFHSTPALLERLNPSVSFDPGTTIQVPNVEPMSPPAAVAAASSQPSKNNAPAATGTAGRSGAPATDAAAPADVVVRVKGSASSLSVEDAAGQILLYAPVTTGSQHDPLPAGEWKVNGVRLNPKFNYNPDLFWDADLSHSKATIQPGPNNPVGLVWIDLSKPHYGIHGTPEPSTIGRTESHGCIRLTNWDALKLARLVKPGTRVILEQ